MYMYAYVPYPNPCQGGNHIMHIYHSIFMEKCIYHTLKYCHVNNSFTGCNIGCKTLFSERGKLPSKLTGPAGTSTCPATLLNSGEIDFAKTLLAERGKSGSCSACPNAVFLPNLLATGQVGMLLAALSHNVWNIQQAFKLRFLNVSSH